MHDLIIFDNSGVLVDSEVLANQVLAETLTEMVTPTSVEESLAHYSGHTFAAVPERVFQRTGKSVPAGFEDVFRTRLFAVFEDRLTAVPGIVRILDLLDARGIPYCVASNDTQERVRTSLRLTGLLPRIRGDRVIGVDQVAHGKPAPDLFLLAARRCGVPPSACLVIEDSPSGVAAARAAGMTVWAHAALTPSSRLRGADVIFPSMRELYSLLPATPLEEPPCTPPR
ncbi:HAD family hydrolase [Streptomyces hygroscopicus]|uniref:HAD family hydrolase n=1 Tax=Streptomyces hygroscopicus TaxID=1912 RepID=UPI003402DE74